MPREEERMSNTPKSDYSVVIFKEGTPPSKKRKGIFFFTLLSLIVVCQACYWLFANSVEPILLGMPFGLFTVVGFIVLEFVVLLVMYLMEPEEESVTEDAR